MRGAATLLGLLIALGAGYVVYQKAATQGSVAQAPPQEQIDLVGVRAELLSIGLAEDRYLVEHGAYGTIDQLMGDSLLTGGADRRGYAFSIGVDGSRGYRVTATPSRAGWPILEMNETRQISQR